MGMGDTTGLRFDRGDECLGALTKVELTGLMETHLLIYPIARKLIVEPCKTGS